MVLNPDCVRDVLLALEELLVIDGSGCLVQDVTQDEMADCPILSPYSEADILYTVQKLCEAGYINPRAQSYVDGSYDFRGAAPQSTGLSRGGQPLWADLESRRDSNLFYGTRGITYQGHEFLDNIRPKPVWQRTKDAVKEKLGSASLSVLSSVAAEFAKRMLLG